MSKQGPGVWKWVAVCVVSAIVGSGSTMAALPWATRHLQASSTASNTPASSTSSRAPAVTSTNVDVNVTSGITQLVKKAAPAVAAVVNYTSSQNFFTQQTQDQESDIGTGVLIEKNGDTAYLVTNNHVVEGGSKVSLVLESGKHVSAEVVGTDPYTDLAVLKTSATNFSGVEPLPLANSDSIEVGEPVVAIGTPMGLDFTDSVTSGIVSAKSREMPVEEPESQQTLDYQSVIQTDAAINPGNSGGPLLNIEGQVIGITSSKIAEEGVEGIGFAIPANLVKMVASEIIQSGHATHPALGIEAYPVDEVPPSYLQGVPTNTGVYVLKVTSTATKDAGLKAGDVIVRINSTNVQDTADLRTALFETKPGDKVQVTVYRGQKRLTLTIPVQKMSTPNDANGQGQSDDSQGFGDQGGYSSGEGGYSQGIPFTGGW
ncbi:trypsin-like peptidase domain-containing protein [Alicyclobacillus kakegawensis]|uniref:trypsin-like peptidase domain-containing protein n=1 Tax=Alicyclobacillus kakegawensis TaxID=392012 RepID=UPI00082C5EAC|nr:trypsin-like peptidase domain-containing protein [Alicyclobacillus kakegawensis]